MISLRASLTVTAFLFPAMASRLWAGDVADSSRTLGRGPSHWVDVGLSYGMGSFDDVSRYRADPNVPYNGWRQSRSRWGLRLGALTRHLSTSLSFRYVEKQSPTADSMGLDYFASYSTVSFGGGPILRFFNDDFLIPIVVGFAHESNTAYTSVRASGDRLFEVHRISNSAWVEVGPTVFLKGNHAIRASYRLAGHGQAAPSIGFEYMVSNNAFAGPTDHGWLAFGVESSWRSDQRYEFMVYLGLAGRFMVY